jgi:hypothetical protein
MDATWECRTVCAYGLFEIVSGDLRFSFTDEA